MGMRREAREGTIEEVLMPTVGVLVCVLDKDGDELSSRTLGRLTNKGTGNPLIKTSLLLRGVLHRNKRVRQWVSEYDPNDLPEN